MAGNKLYWRLNMQSYRLVVGRILIAGIVLIWPLMTPNDSRATSPINSSVVSVESREILPRAQSYRMGERKNSILSNREATTNHSPQATLRQQKRTVNELNRRNVNRRKKGGLSVLSFNMGHRDKPDDLAVMVDHLYRDLSQLPDFILCQEVLFERVRGQGQDNTASVLASLIGYHSKGTKRKSDREGVAIVSRYPFAYYSANHLVTRTNPLLLGFRRVSVMGEFVVPGSGRVRVVNVHLAHMPFEHRVRGKQLIETLQWVQDRENQVHADITFLGGDFNMKPHWQEMSMITDPIFYGSLGFENFNSYEPTKDVHSDHGKRIDYIFVAASDRAVALLEEKILWKHGIARSNELSRLWVSDHLLVFHSYGFDLSNALTLLP